MYITEIDYRLFWIGIDNWIIFCRRWIEVLLTIRSNNRFKIFVVIRRNEISTKKWKKHMLLILIGATTLYWVYYYNYMYVSHNGIYVSTTTHAVLSQAYYNHALILIAMWHNVTWVLIITLIATTKHKIIYQSTGYW